MLKTKQDKRAKKMKNVYFSSLLNTFSPYLHIWNINISSSKLRIEFFIMASGGSRKLERVLTSALYGTAIEAFIPRLHARDLRALRPPDTSGGGTNTDVGQ